MFEYLYLLPFILIPIGSVIGWFWGKHEIKNIPKGYELALRGRIFYYKKKEDQQVS